MALHIDAKKGRQFKIRLNPEIVYNRLLDNFDISNKDARLITEAICSDELTVFPHKSIFHHRSFFQMFFAGDKIFDIGTEDTHTSSGL